MKKNMKHKTVGTLVAIADVAKPVSYTHLTLPTKA